MVWFAFALMTAAALLCVAWPLLHPRRRRAAGASDVAFYRDQLAELDADVDRGILQPADAEATRAELGRRLIRAADVTGAEPPAGPRRVAVALAAGVAVLAVAGGVYADVGRPDLPDAPLAARRDGTTDFAAAIAKIEAHLAADPDDGRGLAVMAPIYMKMGRFGDAARTYRDLIRVVGPTAERRAALGQALAMAADGVVTAEAREAFDAALKEDPALPQARFFQGLAALQDGDKAKARAVWMALVAEAPPGAPYADTVRRRIAGLDGAPVGAPAPAPSAAAAEPAMPAGAAAVAALPADRQRVAIRGMVDGLAARLAEDGQDADGWLRLVRAYRVLGEDDKAVKALADARRSMSGNAPVLGRLDRLAHELGLES
ncbi:c-type cytochrome biogenesis protein CcmI [Lichenibacterium ramalinae]|uniref:C-type cytochrome biogenesis protein CcmI n=1 Tax=Lichenibacterium ramalinae TaxID=2316527 RepID=A0A4Q2RCZ9_9HYPH|nr:c-type cytochrome biogenesis protein CcmI [Lichenibacterium ramalinae]RYB05586.1 c-type cytochrome biogenesis protein CcmI [Lichenibacterium ramalinae]